ncbi:prominin-1-like [Centruroides vittatus]|uniref:prominin-1-like n=1 Tax=Centruroides vittatus TaxID=120091 RepID=UPI0035104D1C
MYNCAKETFQAVFSILNGTEEFLEREIAEKMSPLQNLTNSAELVVSGVSNFTDNLHKINMDGDSIFNNSELIKQKLNHIKGEVEELKERCTSDECKKINPDQFSIENLNFQNDFIKNALDSFSKLNSTEFESSLQNITEIIERLPKGVSVQTKSLQNEIKSGLSKISNELNDAVTKLMSDVFPETEKALHNASTSMKQYMQSGKKYDSYGQYTTLGICIIMTVIVSFLIIGLFFGICGYQNNRPPTKRTTMSNVGGHFLLISVTWMFIFSGIFMLFTIILFLLGSITDTYVCQPLYDKNLSMVNKILENIMNNTKTKIKIPYIGEIAPGDVISKCNSNETIFTILDLENRLNLSEKLDFEKKLNAEKLIQELKDNITFPEMKLINDETETFLTNTMEVLKLESITKGIKSYNESKTIDIDEQLEILKNLSETESELKSEIDAILNNITDIISNLIQFNKEKVNLLRNFL